MSGRDIQNYPSLSPEEFTEACHFLERQYCQATLGPLRKRWKLRLCIALDLTMAFISGHTTYVQIVRPLEPPGEDADLAIDLESLSFSEKGDPILPAADMDMAELEDDPIAISRPSVPDFGYVVYEIHLHPTYRVPCLWFTLHNLPLDEPAFDIDTVFRRLVPQEYNSALRGAGNVGGLSADHHPITGVPSFYIHPCLLGDAISEFHCSKENYLTIWLGLVGGCVGLWVPKEMAIQT